MMPVQLSATDENFDYIICGGGTAGCTLAGRLSEVENITVLLLEAGPDNRGLDDVDMVLGATNLLGTEHDWNFETIPNPGLNNRKVKTGRGKFLSGSSGCNGTICARGTRQDFNSWGLDGWSGDEMFEYMSKAETFQTEDWFDADAKSHGYSGPLKTELHDPAPISKLVMKSFESSGLAYEPDMFSTGRHATGCGHTPRTISRGVRSTAMDYIKKGSRQSNVTVKTNTLVDKITLTKNSDEVVADGVLAISKEGVKFVYRANKEVIICGGAYCSPAILMRSGIGPKTDLEQQSIECVIDLPGVGANLLDHLVVWIFYELSTPDLTIDRDLYFEGGFSRSLALWKNNKTGTLSRFPFGSYAFARLDDRLADESVWKGANPLPGRDPMGLDPKTQPNVEFFNSECFFGLKGVGQVPVDGQYVFAMGVQLMGAKSTGSVRLSSADPSATLVVDHNYLAEPLDLVVLSEGCKLVNDIVTKESGTSDVIKGSWPSSSTHHKYSTRNEWAQYVKEYATTCYHPAGTCRMGKQHDAMAVVDNTLQVHGVGSLRVVDASIMPTLNCGHPQMPVYGIAEKAADLIKSGI